MSGWPQSIRFVSGLTNRDASDRIPDDALVTQNGSIVGVQDEAPSRSQTTASYLQGGADVLRQKSWRDTLRAGMTVVRGSIGRDALGSQHFNAARVFN